MNRTTLSRCDRGLSRAVCQSPPEERRGEAGGNAHIAGKKAHEASKRRHDGNAAVADKRRAQPEGKSAAPAVAGTEACQSYPISK